MQQHHEHQKRHAKKHKRRPAGRSNLQLHKESDWIANADASDDKEVESEMGDGEDEIVFDSGFALAGGLWANNAYKNDQYGGDLLFAQTGSEMESQDLFLTEGFKNDHPTRIRNALY